MPINWLSRQQLQGRIFGWLSAALSLLIVCVILLNWLEQPVAKKLSKKTVMMKSELVQRNIKRPPAKSQSLSSVRLPPPPKISPIKIIRPKNSQVTKKPISKTYPRLVPTKAKPRETLSRRPLKALKPSPIKSRPFAQGKSQKAPKLVATVQNQPISVNKKDVEKGRSLLRLLEHGEGPTIEFAWPESGALKSRLFQILVQCHGMRVAMLDDRERLFVKESQSGKKWQINLDLYSAFMRQISGRSTNQEAQELSEIERRQSGLAQLTPIRIFSRRMDAYVLGGLGHIVGRNYRSQKNIRARYELNGNDIVITDIIVDGRRREGGISVACPVGRRVSL